MPPDGDAYFGLPKPYSVPTPGCTFREMYYWDSYFTNVGFLAVGNVEQAKNNVENILYMIDRFGYMPNGSRKRYLYHSQPPFFAQMVKEIFEADGDMDFLSRAYGAMKKEWNYWVSNRSFENGLAHYGFLAEDPHLQETRREAWKRRTGLEPDEDIRVNVGNFIGGCESGWDCNPRWESHSYLYAAPDLNALLWNLEQRLADFSVILNTGEVDVWQTRADQRKARVSQYLWNEQRGCFSDLHSETGEFGKVFSAAAFYPLYVGMATKEQAAATVRSLSLLEHPFGIVPCEKYEGEGTFQWAAPNVWPCLQWMVIGALLVLMYRNAGVPYVFPVLTAATMIIIFRELAVTSIRLVASSSSGVVIAAKYIGKIKTVSQIICICAVILEPLIYSLITPLSFLSVYMPLTYLTTAVTVIFTVWSGIDYLVSYWKYLDPQK